MRSIISLYILFFRNYILLLLAFIFVKKHRLPYRKERYINALGVMHNAVLLPVRATRCRYRPGAWVWVRLAWPGSAAQGKPRRRQTRQAVALHRPGKTRKVSPGFEKYCSHQILLTKPLPPNYCHDHENVQNSLLDSKSDRSRLNINRRHSCWIDVKSKLIKEFLPSPIVICILYLLLNP